MRSIFAAALSLFTLGLALEASASTAAFRPARKPAPVAQRGGSYNTHSNQAVTRKPAPVVQRGGSYNTHSNQAVTRPAPVVRKGGSYNTHNNQAVTRRR